MSRKTYGYRRIGLWLRQKRSVVINHKAVLRLMNCLCIRSVARQRKGYTKTSQLETYHCYENVLNRDFHASRPNQKWVTDITYIATQQGWAYLSTIKDLFGGYNSWRALFVYFLVLNRDKQAVYSALVNARMRHHRRRYSFILDILSEQTNNHMLRLSISFHSSDCSSGCISLDFPM